MNVKNKGRTAVLLYGFIRSANMTHGSLLNNVVIPNDADIFYFGPDATDKPASSHGGIFDAAGFIKINPKNDTQEFAGGISEQLESYYGSRLKSFELHDKPAGYFSEMVSFVEYEQWLFSLNPSRFASMFFNMQGAFKLMVQYENEHGLKYDHVILTRPDLAFYSRIETNTIRDGYVYIPDGVGFCPHTGNRRRGLGSVFFYVNRTTGEYIPTNTGFNDQLLVFSRDTAQALDNLLESAVGYMKKNVPLTPETLIYFHLIVCGKNAVKYMANWVYEIIRIDDKPIKNITDLIVLDIIDRYHPAVLRREKSQRIKYFLKSVRLYWRTFRQRCI